MSTLSSKNTGSNIKDSTERSTNSIALEKQFTQSIDGLNKKQNKLESDIQKRCAQAINSTVDNKASDSKPLVQKALASKSKRPLIYEALTTLAFLGAAAILYFTSSKQSLKMTGLVLAAISIPVGLAVIIYYCSTLNSKLQSTQIPKRDPQFNKNIYKNY